MICPICRSVNTRPGFASVTLERDSTTLLFKDVPAQVCENCGEEFIDEAISANLLSTAEAAVNEGVQVELRRYAAA
jgi:YgiT-type zinc finger domain-containing protein